MIQMYMIGLNMNCLNLKDLTKDSDSSDESSVHTPLDYDDPDNNWV